MGTFQEQIHLLLEQLFRESKSHHQWKMWVFKAMGKAALHRHQGKLQPVLLVFVLLCDRVCCMLAWAMGLCSV